MFNGGRRYFGNVSAPVNLKACTPNFFQYLTFLEDICKPIFTVLDRGLGCGKLILVPHFSL